MPCLVPSALPLAIALSWVAPNLEASPSRQGHGAAEVQAPARERESTDAWIPPRPALQEEWGAPGVLGSFSTRSPDEAEGTKDEVREAQWEDRQHAQQPPATPPRRTDEAEDLADAAAHNAAEAAEEATEEAKAETAVADAASEEAKEARKAAAQARAADKATLEASSRAAKKADAEVAAMSAAEASSDQKAIAEGFEDAIEFHEGEDEEHDEEEEEFDSVDISISWMLLGTVTSVMGLFVVVNVRDDDLRRYAWNIISTTISIFTAVLVFSGFNVIVMTLTQELSETANLIVVYLVFVLLFLSLQVTIAMTSGAICEPPPPPLGNGVDLDRQVWIVADPVREDHETEVEEYLVERTLGDKGIARKDGLEIFVKRVRQEYDLRNQAMKCWATLLAHMAGFAAINAGGVLQHQTYFAGSPASCSVAVLCNQAGLFLLFRVVDWIREVREDEAERDRRDFWFDEEVVLAENDISSLAVSFLLVQVLRFSLSGVLPNVEGLEIPEEAHSATCVLSLVLGGIMMALFAVLLVGMEKFVRPTGQGKLTYIQRFLRLGQSTCAMSFAWCLLWATRWQAVRWRDSLTDLGISSDTIAGRIALAIFLTVVAFGIIAALDRVEDMGLVADEQGSSILTSMIYALSILVGFSWEHCFESAVAAVASLTPHPGEMKGIIAVFVFVLVVPPWRKYILGRVLRHESLNNEKKEIQQKSGRARTQHVLQSRGSSRRQIRSRVAL